MGLQEYPASAFYPRFSDAYAMIILPGALSLTPANKAAFNNINIQYGCKSHNMVVYIIVR